MNRWERVQELFEETAALAGEERARVLEILRERAQGDAELVRAVEALLAAEATPLEVLDGTAGDLWRAMLDEPDPELLCGAGFGPYRVEEHLSSGGMGHVYRATRASAGTERRVALKVLRSGLDQSAFLAWFQRERETLAALEHEHIVSFLDAGALPDGRPYLVMEYVEGKPLTEWGRGVARRARIALFLQVLAAVQYAHEKLVVHRDLKPSNVLVTAQGAPKLLDFGVAAVLTGRGSTASDRSPLTPGYASPEQLRGEPATATSDVYSLGLLLRELLTGAPPDSTANPAADTNTGVEGRRAADAPALDRDLRAIVDRATAPAAAQRYSSADRMADDLRRYLAHEPVAARRGTWAYRAALFARRNRWPVALAGAVLVALVLGWIGSDLDRRRAQSDASLGWGAHAQAKVVARVFERWIADAAAREPALGAEATAHLERALRDDLTELPEAETLVRLTLAELYAERGETARAAAHAERAWALAQATPGLGERERERARALHARLAVLPAPGD